MELYLLIAIVIIQGLLCGSAWLLWVAFEALHERPAPEPCKFQPTEPVPCGYQPTDLDPMLREMSELQVIMNQMRAKPAPTPVPEPREVATRRVEQALAGMGARLLRKRLEIRAAKSAADAAAALKQKKA